MARTRLPQLLKQVSACSVCADLPHGPRPVVRAHPESRILIIGQAPGRRVHESGVPWDDPSGKRLRDWLGVDDQAFYDERNFALVPMGFCYPGTGKSGDLPPRPECAPLWHGEILDRLPKVQTTLLLSRYAIDAYLQPDKRTTLTDVVLDWKRVRPRFIPLPHPSPRNVRWFGKNPWFEEEVVPYLRRRVKKVLAS
jgi:uracil-DNA glycosylase